MPEWDLLFRWFALGGGAGATFVLIKAIFESIVGRVSARESSIDARTEQLLKGLERRLEIERERGDRFQHEIDELRAKLTECTDAHAASEAKVLRLEAMLAGMGDARQHAQLIVSHERTKRDGV